MTEKVPTLDEVVVTFLEKSRDGRIPSENVTAAGTIVMIDLLYSINMHLQGIKMHLLMERSQ